MLVLKELMIEQVRGAQKERKTIYYSHPNPRIIFTVCLTLTIDEELRDIARGWTDRQVINRQRD